MSSMPAGWYPDPFSTTGYVRWWDGERWGASAPAPVAPPAPAATPVQGSGAWSTPVAPMPPPPAYGGYGAPAYGVPVATFRVATWGSRAIARIIDSLIETVLTLPFAVWLMWPAFRDFIDTLPTDGSTPDESALLAFQTQLFGLSLALSLISAVVTFLYEVPMNVRSGQTLGKRMLGIRIRPLAQDVPLTWAQASIRWGTYTVGAMVAGGLFTLLDYLWPLWDKPWSQALHDKAAKTVVVPTR
jgi:uncharacterized RDD family membrane protein YckC